MTILNHGSYCRVLASIFRSVNGYSALRANHKCKDRANSIKSNDVPLSADVVVIGGGSVGCSTAYHLSKMTSGKVVLIEKDKLTSGTTWHTAGLLWRLRPHDTEMEIIDHSRELMTKILKEETGLETGWVETGGLFIASNKERLDEYQVMSTLGEVFGFESHILSPEESLKVHPLLNISDMYGALYSPMDGTIDPSGACTTYSRAAVKYGAKVIEDCEVTNVEIAENDLGLTQVTAVETNLGTIKTNNIVNCTGVDWQLDDMIYAMDNLVVHLREARLATGQQRGRLTSIGQQAVTSGWRFICPCNPCNEIMEGLQHSTQDIKMAGVRVPQIAYKHAYVVTESINGIKTCPNVRDHDGSVYLKRQGDTLQVGGYEPNPILWEKVEKKFAFGLFDLDWDVFGQHIEAACNRVPDIEKSGIRSTVCGPESFTPDGHPLLGEAPEVRGFFHGSGFNSGGMMLGGGAGKQLALWVVKGQPELDMFSMDIRRLPTTLVNEKTWLRERSHETYAKHYSIAFHDDQPLAGRNQRSDPLHQELLSRGCFYEEAHGWERPAYFPGGDKYKFTVEEYNYYGNYGHRVHSSYPYNEQLKFHYSFDFPGTAHKQIGKECLTCRTSAAFINTSYMGKLFLSGPKATDVARRIFSRDVTDPSRQGKCTYTLMLNPSGGIESDLVVATMQDENKDPVYYMTVGGMTTEYCKAHVRKIMHDYNVHCRLEDKTDEMGIISIQGPKSRQILKNAVDGDSSAIAKLKFSSWCDICIAGCPVTLMRISFVGELGFEIHCANEHLLKVYQTVRKHGDAFQAIDAGYRAMNSLSSEIGFHHWGHTIRIDDNVFEARLDHLCDLAIRDSVFVGKKSVQDACNQTLRKKLAMFTVDEQIPLFGHEAIWRNGQVVGHIRSAVYGFALGKSVAYGYVARNDGESVGDDYITGGSYEIKRMGVKYPANVFLTNPFDPKFRRMTGKYDDKVNERMRELLNSEYSA